MISAKLLLSIGLCAFAIALGSTILAFNGLVYFRWLVYVSVICGVFVVAIGVIGVATGTIKDDLRR
jgi:hypothetical protein